MGFKQNFARCWRNVFSLYAHERKLSTPADKLLTSMRTTVKCRFEAADRLRNYSRFSFFTTTYLSLGLILIPLIQSSNIALAFSGPVLNAMQIFLAVAVLVFSVVIGTAKYDMRAELLTECGNRLKELIREMNRRMDPSKNVKSSKLKDLELRYSKIVTDVENHSRVDYRWAKLDMPRDYFIYGIPRYWYRSTTVCYSLFPYSVPLILIVFETIFIFDMLKITDVMPRIFRIVADNG